MKKSFLCFNILKVRQYTTLLCICRNYKIFVVPNKVYRFRRTGNQYTAFRRLVFRFHHVKKYENKINLDVFLSFSIVFIPNSHYTCLG
jgi:hypothetical protein